ncbi:hypothetical protein [Candidatus Pantoea multigeneris]|uniref:Uncharacterized protein n=1 Tax=Candidatus Pantoea multigeneris TaxID=2608357 RepID=A0ABX0R4M9_9GAMM|nr:hypothetical protein [Pantoea multigeneris]NIF20363.1 hypothetical protein [Pantoea multigeneris]
MLTPEQSSNRWALRQDVVSSEIDSYTLVIAGGQFERALKLTGLGRLMATQLSKPQCYAHLLQQLQDHYPRHSESELALALRTLLAKFNDAGFIQADRDALSSLKLSQPSRPQSWRVERWKLPNPDKLALNVAQLIRLSPAIFRHLLLDFMVALSLFSLSQSATKYAPLDHVFALTPGTCVAVVSLWLIWIVTHEMAHATVCRFYGFPVAGAGLMFRGFFVPSVYVNTSTVQLSPERNLHFQVALAGPLVDLIFAGCCAAIMLTASPVTPLYLTGEYASLGMMMGLFFNLTPFRASDGSSMYYSLFSPAKQFGSASGKVLGVTVARLVFNLWMAIYILLVLALLARITGSIL